jgi:hypothetical protein
LFLPQGQEIRHPRNSTVQQVNTVNLGNHDVPG